MIHIEGFRITSLEQLDDIKSGCESSIKEYALGSAVTGLVPVPGLDIAADIGLMIKMFLSLRGRYSLDNVNASDFSHYVALSSFANEVFQYVTKEGIITFLTKYGAKAIGKKTATKYIPIIGQAIAAYTGFKLTEAMGIQYSSNCYNLCREILRN